MWEGVRNAILVIHWLCKGLQRNSNGPSYSIRSVIEICTKKKKQKKKHVLIPIFFLVHFMYKNSRTPKLLLLISKWLMFFIHRNGTTKVLDVHMYISVPANLKSKELRNYSQLPMSFTFSISHQRAKKIQTFESKPMNMFYLPFKTLNILPTK